MIEHITQLVKNHPKKAIVIAVVAVALVLTLVFGQTPATIPELGP